MFRHAAVVCALLAVAVAYVAISPLEEKPEKFKDVKGCYIKELDDVIPVGEKASVPADKGCFQYRCYKTSMDIEGCGSVSASPPLKVVSDKTKQYPDCCPKIVGPQQ